ncbi:uncharacterized protein LOC110116985 [Athalia rosae]|uniref:uncharacterized protein LOC110116985 n=1 Tax=Athalia rosae TaxID=37344 RepID=UPI0020345EE2|nr:uncharacterized protein LOC110116985 [Athalia rosae]
MKIRVTFLFLLCTSSAVNTSGTLDTHRASPDNFMKSENFYDTDSKPKHRVFEYSNRMETDSHDEVRGQSIISFKRSGRVFAGGLANIFDRSLGRKSQREIQDLAIVRFNSKQPSRILDVGSLGTREKVLSRKKKDKMTQFMLPLLVAYKLKFAALIPVLLGGMSLLASTTALAGFFFALFAAVLGLKTH